MKEGMKNFLINLMNFGASARLLKEIEGLKTQNEELKAKNTALSDSNFELAKKDVNLVLEKTALISEKAAILKDNEEMITKDKAMTKLFALIAHDLRSPFHAFLGFTELLSTRHDELSTSKRKEYINLMRRQAENVYLLLTNLLDWSRTQLGARPVTLVNLDLKEATDNIIGLLKANAHEKRINLINEVPIGTIVSADAGIVDIVIRNLIANAIKFTDSEGTITISVAITADGLARISVTDTGIGIKPESLKKLFSPEFYSTPGTNKEQGTGLGLLFCREMIEQQGGSISAESTVGKGTTMTFTVKAVE